MMTSGTRPAPAAAYRFELSGGALCLDFVNTVEGRPTHEPVDHLQGWGDLVGWAQQSGIISEREAVRTLRDGRPGPAGQAAILERARALREALFGIFSSVAAGRTPPEAALERLNLELPAALASLRLERSGGAFEWRWSEEGPASGRILARVVDSAADLLTSPDRTRVRECRSESCAWLFVDASRNRTRRWCDMSVCGNRAKARRHYHRTRGAPRRNKDRRGAV